ncbi:hypothetical protein [Citrobacter freundii]|uniref:hypothetical protein n=1 Tax=Citrobacter freundii TaxID=546 RepID=UPI000D6FA159|nr:hypothetical protein [Citrobacter freundii]
MKIVDIDTWAPYVGTFMLEFGAVESLTLKILKKHTSEIVFKHVKNIGLGNRIKFIKDLITSSDIDNDITEEFIETLKKIEKLSEIRNIIAHNTVKLVFWTNIESDDIPYEEALCNDKNDRIITLSELKDHTTELSILVKTLYRLDAMNRGRKVAKEMEYFQISGLSIAGLDDARPDA